MAKIEVDVKNVPEDAEDVKDVEIQVGDCQCCSWKKLRGKSCPVCGTNHTMKRAENTWYCEHCGYMFSSSDQNVDVDSLEGRTRDVFEFQKEALDNGGE